MTNKRVRPWRRLAEALQALLVLGLPFVRIKGESALRFDIPSLRLHFFGASLWMDEFFIVLIAIIFLTFLIIFITVLFGRIWCGWLCPQTVLIDFTWFLDRAGSKGLLQKAVAYLLTLLISIIVAANLIWYFVSPYDFFPDLLTGSLGTVTGGFWISLAVMIFLNYAFLRNAWCSTVCPYSKIQGALFDRNTMVIAFDQRRKEECMNCRACIRTCPAGIDIRNGLSAACINCAECIDACQNMMDKRRGAGLIGYFFGSPGEERKLLRQNVVLVGSITTLTLFFLLYLSIYRSPIDLTVLPNYELRPRLTEQHEIVNTYTLALKNRGRQDLELTLRATHRGKDLDVAPEKVRLSAGEYKRVVAYVIAPAPVKDSTSATVELIVETDKLSGLRLSKKVNFVLPEAM